MKAPLRLAFGWVIYVAIFASINPVVISIWQFASRFPAASVVSAVASIVALIALWFIVGSRFYRWLDEPRRPSCEL